MSSQESASSLSQLSLKDAELCSVKSNLESVERARQDLATIAEVISLLADSIHNEFLLSSFLVHIEIERRFEI